MFIQANKVLLPIVLLAGLCIIFLTGVSSFAHGEGEEAAELLVLVNGDSITTANLNAVIMKNHAAFQQMSKSGADYRNLLTKLVNDYLILQEAYSLSMDQEDWVIEYMDDKLNKKAMSSFIKDYYKPDLSVSDEELDTFFRDYYFKLLIRTVSLNTRAEADTYYNMIINGSPMDSIAEAVSIDSRKFQGGLHKIKFYADTDTILRQEAMKLENQQVSSPFVFRDGFVILKLEERFAPDSMDLKMLTNKLTGMLIGQKKEASWNKFIDSLVAANNVQVSDDILKKINSEGDILFTADFLQSSDSIAIRINDSHLITEGDLRKKISHTAMEHGTKTIDQISEIALEQLIAENVVSSEALADGYRDTEEAHKYYYEKLDSVLIENYLKEMIVSKITFNREEFKNYYTEHADDFKNPDRFQFDQLILSTQDSAQYYIDRINTGSDFNFIKKQVIPGYKDEPVDVEWTLATLLPEDIQNDLKTVAPGHAVGPYEVRNGWLLFYVLTRENGDVKPYDAVEGEIRQIFFQKLFNEQLDAHLQLLTDNSEIKYFEDKIKKYFEE